MSAPKEAAVNNVAVGGGGTASAPLIYPTQPPPPAMRSLLKRPEISESLSVQDEENEINSNWGVIGRMLYNALTRGRVSNRKRRVVEKNGDCNVQYKNISKRRRRYLTDIYTTLVDSSWSESLLLFALSFYVTWLTFAFLYYLICYLHGDLEPEHLPGTPQETSGWKPCVLEFENFASSFLFSLETQHTIGYGSRQTTNECVEAMIVMSLQSIIGCLIQAFMVGLVFAKLCRPRFRTRTVVFSRNAVICERDGKLCLVFRVGDMRDDSFIVGTQVSAKIIRRRCTDEGEMHHDTQPINIRPDTSCEPCILLIWPLTLIHVIDEDSPFYE